MSPRIVVLYCLLITILLTTVPSAHAQQPGKIPRVAYVTGASFTAMEYRIEAFRQGLRDLGYTERKNILIEWRYAEEKPSGNAPSPQSWCT